jgi:hypothetical protein
MVSAKAKKVVAPKKTLVVKKKVAVKAKKTSPKGEVGKKRSASPVKKDAGIKR